MPGKISILRENGETLSSNIVSIFTIPETEKKYIITTENTVDPHGLTVLHVSELVDDTLARIATNEEWDSIKTIMRAVISGNVGSYTYLPAIVQARIVNPQYSRDISVSSTAAKQMSDAYAASNVASNDVGAAPAPVVDSVPAQPVVDPATQIPVAAQPAPMDMQVQAPVAPVQPVAPVAVQPATTPASIFPVGNVVPTEENEISPGIAEIGGNDNVNSMSRPIMATGESTVPVDPAMASPANVTATVEPVMPISVTPTMDPIQQPMAPQVPQAPVDGGMSSMVPPMVPQAQIVQPVENNVQEIPSIALNFNATPNFGPNATLDEVVSGSQDIFMESVRNLVQTMTEKIYRDLYQKEAMLKERETLLNDREKMLNAQMMSVMNNFGAQNGIAAAPQMMQPMQQPMQAMPQVPQQPVAPQVVQPMATPVGQAVQPMTPVAPMVGSVQVTPIANVNPQA